MEHLSFPVDPDDASSRLMGSSDENCLPADPVHVDAGTGLKVIQVDVAIFGDKKDYILFGTDLQVQEETINKRSIKNYIKQGIQRLNRAANYTWSLNYYPW